MSTITLNNRVTSYSDSDAAFVSCTALPIQQTTLNVEEMADIDGLWDWGDFGSAALEGAAMGVLGGLAGVAASHGAAAIPAVAAASTALATPPGWVAAIAIVATTAATGAILGAGNYAYNELVSDN